MTRHLCVGGPVSGKMVDPEGGPGFRVPIYKQTVLEDAFLLDREPAHFDYFEYELHVFYGTWIWVPKNQTREQTMSLLMVCFSVHGKEFEKAKSYNDDDPI